MKLDYCSSCSVEIHGVEHELLEQLLRVPRPRGPSVCAACAHKVARIGEDPERGVDVETALQDLLRPSRRRSS